METRSQIRARVQDLLHIQSTDLFHTPSQIDTAINDALLQAVDRLAATTARRRYMVRVPDLSVDPGLDTNTLAWTLPDNFRRPFKLVRERTEIEEVEREEDFDLFGVDGYMVIGRELLLTEDTDPSKLVVWYIYTPPKLVNDTDTPDWVEGYERFLSLEAAAVRAVKADVESPAVYRNEAAGIWPYLLIAARQSAFPSKMRSEQQPAGETWY